MEDCVLIYYKLSPTQLETKAEEVLQDFDSERLQKPKPLDVYDFVDFYMHLPYDWMNITPDQSVLGFSAFNDGYWWEWKNGTDWKNGDLPVKTEIKNGTIIIDNSLINGNNRGCENFTVIHECFHQLLHQKSFSRARHGIHQCNTKDFYATLPSTNGWSTRAKIEWQANACTTAFLMPRNAVNNVFQETFHSNNKVILRNNTRPIIEKMAHDFNSSYAAMCYRLNKLDLLTIPNNNLKSIYNF